jgi:hypothetical protein
MRLVEEGFHALYMDSDNIVLGPLLKTFSSAWDVQGLSDWVDPELLPTGKCLLRPSLLQLLPLLLGPLATAAAATSAHRCLHAGAGAASSAAPSGPYRSTGLLLLCDAQPACSTAPRAPCPPCCRLHRQHQLWPVL